MDPLEEPSEDPEIILADIRRQRNQDETYIMPSDEPQQTIILLGRTRAGKTTIPHVIKDSLYCSILMSCTESENPVSHRIGGLHIVDMPNIFDERNRPYKLNINSQGLRIGQFEIPVCDNVPPLFGFVLSIQKGVSSDDITALINFKNTFDRLSSKMVLVLTHCEEKTARQRLQIINEFFDNSQLMNANVRNFFRRGVLFMGCIRAKSVETRNRQALMYEHQQVLQMRAEFIQHCQQNDSIFEDTNNISPNTDSYFYRVQTFFMRHQVCICYALLGSLIGIGIAFCFYRKGNRVVIQPPFPENDTSTPFDYQVLEYYKYL